MNKFCPTKFFELLPVGSRKDRRGNDLAEDEDARHRHEDGRPRGHQLVQEQRQGLVEDAVAEEQSDHEPVVGVQGRQRQKLLRAALFFFVSVFDL